MPLKCPFCEHVWQPKVVEPRSCPMCKRYPTVSSGPFTLTDQVPVKDMIPRLPEVKLTRSPSSPNPYAYVQCSFPECTAKAVLKIGRKSYCEVHILDAVKEASRLDKE